MSPGTNFSTDCTVKRSVLGYTLPYDRDDINICVYIYTSFWKMFQVYVHDGRWGAIGSIATRLKDTWSVV
jgi:hypothetical protein